MFVYLWATVRFLIVLGSKFWFLKNLPLIWIYYDPPHHPPSNLCFFMKKSMPTNSSLTTPKLLIMTEFNHKRESLNVLKAHFYLCGNFVLVDLSFFSLISLRFFFRILCIEILFVFSTVVSTYEMQTGFSYFVICNSFMLKWDSQIEKCWRKSQNIDTRSIQYKCTFLDKVI